MIPQMLQRRCMTTSAHHTVEIPSPRLALQQIAQVPSHFHQLLCTIANQDQGPRLHVIAIKFNVWRMTSKTLWLSATKRQKMAAQRFGKTVSEDELSKFLGQKQYNTHFSKLHGDQV